MVRETHSYLKEMLGSNPSHRDVADEIEANYGKKIHPDKVKEHLKGSDAAPTLEQIYARAGANG